MWANIAANVNACRVANRTVEDIKKKWNDFKSAALNSVWSQMKTWGGPHIKPPPFAELVLNVIGEQSDAAHGIEGINYLIYSFKGIVYLIDLGMRNKTNNFNSEMVLTNFLLDSCLFFLPCLTKPQLPV